MEQILLRILLASVQNQSYFFSKINKTYELSVYLHESNTADKELENKAPAFLTVSYNVALPICLLKLEYGFAMDIYSLQDYSAVFLWLNQFYDLQTKNLSLSIQLFNPIFKKAALELGKDVEKYKDLISDEDRVVLLKYNITRAKKAYSDVMFKLFTWLRHKGFINVYGREENFAARYNNVFKVFDDCIFCKTYDYYYFLQRSNGFISEDLQKSFAEMKNTLNDVRKEVAKSQNAFGPEGQATIKHIVRVS